MFQAVWAISINYLWWRKTSLRIWTRSANLRNKPFISSSRQHFKKWLVLQSFSIKSDPSTPLLSPHCHRWKPRVEKLGSQGNTCSSVETPGDAHMARMKIFIRIGQFRLKHDIICNAYQDQRINEWTSWKLGTISRFWSVECSISNVQRNIQNQFQC